MTKQDFVSELGAEFIGSMFLVMTAISSMVMFTAVFDAPKSVAVLANAISVALVLIVLIEIFGPFSGAHFNPIVTMIMTLEKKIGVAKVALFMLFQFAGGIAGATLSHLMFFDRVGSLLATSDNVRNDYVYFGEIFGTFILVLAILLLVKIGSKKISIIVGLLVGGQLLATSSTMFANPQVTLARMFSPTASGIRPFDALVFIAMQVIGALLAYGVYRLVFAKKKLEEEENE